MNVQASLPLKLISIVDGRIHAYHLDLVNPCKHKTMRWYRKISVHILQMLLLNSHAYVPKYNVILWLPTVHHKILVTWAPTSNQVHWPTAFETNCLQMCEEQWTWQNESLEEWLHVECMGRTTIKLHTFMTRAMRSQANCFEAYLGNL